MTSKLNEYTGAINFGITEVACADYTNPDDREKAPHVVAQLSDLRHFLGELSAASNPAALWLLVQDAKRNS